MAQRYVLLCAVALLASSTGAAAWMGKGSFEPSTSYDTEGLYNHFVPDTSPNPNTKMVYFNGFTTQGSPAATTALAPNVAAVGSTLQIPYSATYVMLGVWKDCNKDGYIGSGETMWRYPVQLLPSDNACAIDTEFPTHNDGSWVMEWQPITWNNETRLACCDANSLVDNQAQVWMDVGLPSDEFPLPACLAAPPRFYNQTGAMLAKADCETGYAVTTVLNAYGPDELAFEDVQPGRQGESSSMLNQHIPTGDDTDSSYVTAFDCSKETTVVSVPHVPGYNDLENPVTGESIVKSGVPGVVIWDFTDDDGWLLWTEVNPNPTAPSLNDGGSLWGTVNATQSGPTDCDGTNGNSFSDTGVTGNTSVGQQAQGHDCLVYCESTAYSRYIGKTQPSMMLQSEQWPEDYDRSDLVGQLQNEHLHLAYGGSVRQFWLGGLLPTQSFLSTRDLSPAPSQYYTYYGFVSPAAVVQYGLTLPGGTGTYGADACALSAMDNVVRFNCDRANWWTRLDGSEIPPSATGLSRCSDQCDPRAFLGDIYNFRDIDCYDQSVAAQRELGLTFHALVGDGGC